MNETAKKYEQSGALNEFDAELERLAIALDTLTAVVEPISNRYMGPEVALADPRSEPQTALHGRVERLSDLTTRLNEITGQILL